MQARARGRTAIGRHQGRRWTTWCGCACLWLGIAGPAAALDPAVPVDRYTVTRWTIDEGLPHNQIHDIGQAADGFLWVATWEGSARFEGHEFRAPGGAAGPLPSRSLLRDGEAMLVGGIQAGLWRFPVGGAPVQACAEHPRLDVWSLERASPELLWVATSAGLFRIDAAGACRREGGESDALRGQPLMSMLAHPDGSLWIGGLRGLHRYRDGRLQDVGAALGLPPGAVRRLALDGDGAVWLAGDRGVWRHDGRTLRRLREDSAEAMLQDRHGAQWVVTSAGEVLRHWRGAWERLDADHGLQGRGTGALFEDREGLVWVGTTHGLFRIADGPAWGIGHHQGLGDEYVRSLLQTADGTIWAGHAGGLSRWRDGRFEQVYPARPDEDGSSVLALARAGGGGVWIGTYNRGVLRMGPEPGARARPLYASAGAPADSVRALLEDASGSLWIGSERGVSRWQDGAPAPVPLAGAPALPVRAIQQAADGGLWIGMLGALVRRDADGGVQVWKAEQDMPANSVLDVRPDPDGALWIATDRGVMQHRDGRFAVHGEGQGIPASAVFRILDDGLGNFWFSGNRGVFRVPRASFDQVARGERGQLELALFGQEDGLPSRQANGGSAPAGWAMADGRLWIPTAAGIAVIDPARVQREQHERVPLVIDRVEIDGVEQVRGADAGVVPPAARLTIDFAGVSLRQPRNLRYRYRMHGFDRGWVDAGAARSVSYTNLPPGELRFEVQVVRATADWDTPAGEASARFRVDAPWWRRPSALALGALAALALLLAMHLALGRHQRRRQRRLQRLVDRRTEELSQKNRQLELATHQLERQASHDPLTDLPNRRAGDRFLAEAIVRSRIAGQPLCVAVVDVDRFKEINDRHGHQAGDQVLARVAARLRAALAKSGDGTFVGRHGGEEFLVVMPDCVLNEAVLRLDAAREAVSAPGITTLDGSPLSCTISAGVVESWAGATSDDLLQYADARLYGAKRRGRNRVIAG